MRNAFHLTPIALAIYPLQTIKVSDTRPPCNSFNYRDCVNYLEVHSSYLRNRFSPILVIYQ